MSVASVATGVQSQGLEIARTPNDFLGPYPVQLARGRGRVCPRSPSGATYLLKLPPRAKDVAREGKAVIVNIAFIVEGSARIAASAGPPMAVGGAVIAGCCKLLFVGDTTRVDSSPTPANAVAAAAAAAAAAALTRSLALKKFCAFSDKRISGARGAWYDGMSVSSGGRADR